QPLDPLTARNTHNYQIKGPAGRLIRVRSVAYDPSTWTVIVHPAELLNIHRTYHFMVRGDRSGGVVRTDGRLLDGAGSGQPGSNFQARIDWRVLVLDRFQSRSADAGPV